MKYDHTNKLCNLLLKFEKSLRLSPYKDIEKKELLGYAKLEKRFFIENSLFAVGNMTYYNFTGDTLGSLVLTGLLATNVIRWMAKYRM